MLTYHCDGCGEEIPAKTLRYTVRVDVRAAYDTMEVGLTDLVRDHRQEILRLIDRLGQQSVKEVEESVYMSLQFDLCPACQRAYVNDPLRFHPEQAVAHDPIDIDHFLRSLGYGGGTDEDSA